MFPVARELERKKEKDAAQCEAPKINWERWEIDNLVSLKAGFSGNVWSLRSQLVRLDDARKKTFVCEPAYYFTRAK